ncbi:uncharacterized protein H6S33_005042 [Morchella sextelata]|uniref:uncharacterized protein n=1 Tax=Morchella sextelata TaxID=1174677 RepID=UPI001D0503AF|nr:uncharacterized protein H6S33_005042 [Morchella sextelata]KAH0605060.1 hypothetical protein H6S33_005042 [Morchella sextelata]
MSIRYAAQRLSCYSQPPLPLASAHFLGLRACSIPRAAFTPPPITALQRRTPPCPPTNRQFHAAPRMHKDHHFDTLKFVQKLQEEGFSEEQSVALMRALSDVIEESIQNLTRTMVLKEDQEKITYAQKVDFAKLRSELATVHSGELKPIRSEQERLTSEIARLNARLREEMQRTQSSVRLDLNLEKGRIREESSVHELKIKETDSRIEKEVGDLRGLLESVKFSTLQWLIGVCTGTAALLLGVWRLLM